LYFNGLVGKIANMNINHGVDNFEIVLSQHAKCEDSLRMKPRASKRVGVAN